MADAQVCQSEWVKRSPLVVLSTRKGLRLFGSPPVFALYFVSIT